MSPCLTIVQKRNSIIIFPVPMLEEQEQLLSQLERYLEDLGSEKGASTVVSHCLRHGDHAPALFGRISEALYEVRIPSCVTSLISRGWPCGEQFWPHCRQFTSIPMVRRIVR